MAAAARRTYGDSCGIARALDAVGERWALLVVRELLLGPKRFTDLRTGLPGLSTDILAQRLRDLEAAGVVARATLPPPAASKVYELTDRGRELEPVLHALGRWGRSAPFPDPRRPLSADAFGVALSTVFDGARATEDLAIVLRLGDDTFTAAVRDGRLDVVRGEAPEADATIATDVATLTQVLWHGAPLDDRLTVTGSRRAARAFVALFRAP